MTHASDLTNQEKLEEVYEMTKENNDILRSMRRQQHVANAFRFFYWVVILVSLGGVYYYIRPMLDEVTRNKNAIEDTVKQFDQLRSQLPETKAINQLLQNFKGSSSTTNAQNQ